MNVGEEKEKEKRALINWRNLHYFEYGESIRIFNDNDLDEILQLKEMFIRKITSKDSSNLLDNIDKSNIKSKVD